MPTVAFEPPQLRQIGSCAAVTLQGSDPSSSLQYVYTLVDYISEDGVLTAVLTAPDNISPYVDAYELMLANIELTIRSVPPTTTPLPESTLQVTSDAATADVTVEAGTDEAENGTAVTQVTPIAPESSAEAQPQSTLRPEATAELTPSPEAGNVTAEPTTQGAQASTTLTASDTGMFVIGRGIEVLKPEGWEASTNGQTNATLTLGEEVGNALLGNDVLPAGEALISVEIGTVEEVFRQPFGGFDLERWLTNELGRLVADDDSAQAGVIESVVLDETELGLGALISTSKYDRYMIVGQIGTSLYKRVQLYTAPGAFTAYQPILLQITDSIEPAQR
jgi:hypothetical protein